MTEETAQIFDAPWKAVNHMHVVSRSDDPIGVTCDEHNAHRISHLPELYDALMWATVQYCPDAFLSLDECRLCGEKKCKGRECVELLRKLRNGE